MNISLKLKIKSILRSTEYYKLAKIQKEVLVGTCHIIKRALSQQQMIILLQFLKEELILETIKKNHRKWALVYFNRLSQYTS